MDKVSIVIPILNEGFYIKKLIESVLNQDYDHTKLECIFVDGNSDDNTVDLIAKEMKNTDIDYRVIQNPKRLTPISVNVGIKNAKYDIIVRLDAHSEYPSNYITKNVYYLNNTDADNVGCLFDTKGTGIVGKAIEGVLTSRFGVGNSSFRINGKSGYTETVPYGTFRKSLIDKIGHFNEELIRSEDNEFNYRIIKNGGKVYLFNDIAIIYHPRNSIGKLMKMAFENGKWSIYTNYFIPGSMKLRHFIPFFFVLSLISGTVISILKIKILMLLFGIEIGLYTMLSIIFSLISIKRVGIVSALISIIIYPLFHISYGIGSICGIGKIVKRKFKRSEDK